MLVMESERAPLKDMEILQLLEELKQKLLGQTVMRFHSTRPLTSDMKGLATFLLEISQRSKEAQRAWELLHVLMGSSVWQLTAVQYKREGWKKSILNKMVREYLGQCLNLFFQTPPICATCTLIQCLSWCVARAFHPVWCTGFGRGERAWRLLLTKTGSVAMRNMACDYIMVPWMLIVFIGTSSIAFLYAPARGVWICDDDRSGE